MPDFPDADDLFRPATIKTIRRKISEGLLWIPKEDGLLPPTDFQGKYYNAETFFTLLDVKNFRRQFSGGMVRIFPQANTQRHKDIVVKCYEHGIPLMYIGGWVGCTPGRVKKILIEHYGCIHYPKPKTKVTGSDRHALHAEVDDVLDLIAEEKEKLKKKKYNNRKLKK